MIGRLHGIIIEKSPPEILLDVGGVGYELQLPMTCFYELPAIGQEATIITHFVVREDAQLLYGFNTKQERTLFRELLKANGVGPKLALAIMSGMSANQFVSCLMCPSLIYIISNSTHNCKCCFAIFFVIFTNSRITITRAITKLPTTNMSVKTSNVDKSGYSFLVGFYWLCT